MGVMRTLRRPAWRSLLRLGLAAAVATAVWLAAAAYVSHKGPSGSAGVVTHVGVAAAGIDGAAAMSADNADAAAAAGAADTTTATAAAAANPADGFGGDMDAVKTRRRSTADGDDNEPRAEEAAAAAAAAVQKAPAAAVSTKDLSKYMSAPTLFALAPTKRSIVDEAPATAGCPDFGVPVHEVTEWVPLRPTFIVLGGQKCGTTSMYSYLIQHPNIVSIYSGNCNSAAAAGEGGAVALNAQKRAMPRRARVIGNKEVRFFDSESPATMLNVSNYYNYFPLVPNSIADARTTGESTPNYIYSPRAARRIKDLMPSTTKLIVMLRNPVDRAYSHFHHAAVFTERFSSNVTFEDLVFTELAVLEGCETERAKGWGAHTDCHRRDTATHAMNRLPADFVKRVMPPAQAAVVTNGNDAPAEPNKKPRQVWALQLLHRGLYVDQIREYMRLFDKSQLLVLRSEDMFIDPNGFMAQVGAFLGLPYIDWSPLTTKKYNFGKRNQIEVVDRNAARHVPMKEKTREQLNHFFQKYNQQLYALLKEHDVPFTPWE